MQQEVSAKIFSTIDWVLAIHRSDDGMVLDGKNGERLSLKYMREHSSAKAGEPLSLHVITTLSGSWFLPAGEQPLTLTIASGRGPGVPPVSDHGQDGRARPVFLGLHWGASRPS